MTSISLVFTTIDNSRKTELIRMLKSLCEQEMLSFTIELIFVYQKNTHLLDPEIENFIKNNFDNYCIVKTNISSLSKARNIGLEKVTGDIIAFPDDDCWYHNELLEMVTTFFKTNTSDILCTNVYDPNTKLYYGNRPIIKTDITFKNVLILPISVGIFINLSNVKKELVLFNESLGAGTKLGSGEESALLVDLLINNYTIKYDGFENVYHPVLEYNIADIDKYYSYGLGYGYLNAMMLQKKIYSHLPSFVYLLIKSLIAYCIFILNTTKRKVYIRRFRGLVEGFFYCIKLGMK